MKQTETYLQIISDGRLAKERESLNTSLKQQRSRGSSDTPLYRALNTRLNNIEEETQRRQKR